ncbi:MAG: efflux RND transporter periplasmic adaptor subunit [Phycisphaerae bacterium]|nr:efflux RND transporter periplasmic adaptor subunit [Phycisphaerae bacterium]
MTENKSIKTSLKEKPRRMRGAMVGASLKILLSVLIVIGSIAVYRHQISTSPSAGRKKPPRQAKLVQVIPVLKEGCTTTVKGNGLVIPAQQVTLHPQVIGRIMEVSPDVVPGSYVQAEQKLMAIDHRDYEIQVRQRQSEVARADKDLKVEQGNQAVAKQEYKILDEVITDEDRELVLREPQLLSAQAAQESAQAALEKAELDLARCDIVAPFNAVIRQKHTDLGASVSANSELVTLIGTDEAWIEVKVFANQLKWLDIPKRNGDLGANVTIRNTGVWGEDRFRTGRVIFLLGELETQGRLARLLVTVDDPFCLKPQNHNLPQLLMGSYISAEVEGRALPDVFPIKRSHLRDNDTVWIMDNGGQLEIRQVQIVFRGPDRVYVTEGLAENEKLVVTDIAAPVAGMPLRVDGPEEQSEQLSLDMPKEEK